MKKAGPSPPFAEKRDWVRDDTLCQDAKGAALCHVNPRRDSGNRDGHCPSFLPSLVRASRVNKQRPDEGKRIEARFFAKQRTLHSE